MTLGRFVPILALLALAGSLGPRRVAPPGLGTLRTDTPTFVIYLIGFVVDRRRPDVPDRAGARAVRAGAELAGCSDEQPTACSCATPARRPSGHCG